jgi:hypothetical protein
MNKAEALKIVMEDGEKLKVLPEEFKKDRDVVLAAVKNNGWALFYANKNLKKDKFIVLAAIKNEGGAFSYVDSTLKKDKSFVNYRLMSIFNDNWQNKVA